LVQVPTLDKRGRPATKRVQLLSDNTSTDDEDDPSGQITYSFSPGMREIIRSSTYWGWVRKSLEHAWTSKYSISLYNLICARVNLDFKWQEDFSLKDFRALLGVPEDKLRRLPDLLRFCVKVAQDEINGIADFKVDVKPIRRGGKIRGTVTGFRISWWRKNEDELKEAFKEINRSKVGRLARVRGAAEQAVHEILLPPLKGAIV
jgi:plasmid replication initiation protein